MSQPDPPPSVLRLLKDADRARSLSATRLLSRFGSILVVATVTLLILSTASIGAAQDTESQECWYCPVMALLSVKLARNEEAARCIAAFRRPSTIRVQLT